MVSPGDYVTPGRPLVNVEALDTLKLDFALPEQYAGKVAPGQKITAKVDAYPGEEFAASCTPSIPAWTNKPAASSCAAVSPIPAGG